jgi:hypothetical protein
MNKRRFGRSIAMLDGEAQVALSVHRFISLLRIVVGLRVEARINGLNKPVGVQTVLIEADGRPLDFHHSMIGEARLDLRADWIP